MKDYQSLILSCLYFIIIVLLCGRLVFLKIQEPPTLKSVYRIPHDVDSITIPGRDYLIIVNRDFPFNFSSKYNKDLQDDLVFIVNAVDGDVMAVEKSTYLAFSMLQRDVRENDGIDVQLYDGYRTAEDQLFIQSLSSHDPPTTKPSNIGYSEHHTGLILDIVVWMSEDGENYTWYSATPERIEKMPEFQKLYSKLADYGFIVRYPENKTDITGVEGKSFEIRFVGSKEIAHEITEKGLCLEEYKSIEMQ